MKIDIFSIEGKKTKSIDLPSFFTQEIREDLISKILEAKKTNQPYSPNPMAGKQHSASGKLVHRRKVWRSGYGRGMSRIPRKIMSGRGSQFNWTGAEVSSTRGGRRAHPPKSISMINTKKINKKELQYAMVSALSATANKDYVLSKYGSLNEINAKEISTLPFVIESKITSLKIKEILSGFKKILGDELFKLALKKKKVRAGKGKLRGRKYKKNAGVLLVVGEKEKLKTKSFDVKNAKNLGIKDLAKGGPGRLTIYTENAINELQKKLGEKNVKN